jgi:microcystin-dependent protein
MGTGQGSVVNPYVLGQIQGSNTITATISNLPGHTHVGLGNYAISAYSDEGNSGSPQGNSLAALSGLYSNKAPNAYLRPITPTITIGSTGNNQPIPVQQPYLGMNYIICLSGIYPSRQ